MGAPDEHERRAVKDTVLRSIRAVLEREGHALARRHDRRLLDVLVEIDELKLSIARTLGKLGVDGTPGARFLGGL